MWYIIHYICEDGTELKIEMKFYPYAGSDNGINGGRISKLSIIDKSNGYWFKIPHKKPLSKATSIFSLSYQ